MIGLYTSTIIDLFKGDDNVISFLNNTREQVSTTVINIFELYIGLDLINPIHQEEEVYYLELLENMPNFSLDIRSCRHASKILWNLKKQGKIINRWDCAIAAIFMDNGVDKILTKNKKHFENIKGLKVLSY